MFPLRIEVARDHDAAAIAMLRLAAARQLTTQFGPGTWSRTADSEAGVRVDIMTSTVLIARDGGSLLATLRLSTRPPWMTPIACYRPCRSALYLTSMAVAPKYHRCGIGRACVEDAKRRTREWPAEVLRLDAYDATAGAGEFYRKCGFREVGRAPYNGTPLIFFEYLSEPASLAEPLADTRDDSRG